MKNLEEHIDQRVRTFKVPGGRSSEEAWELISSKLDSPQKKVRHLPAMAYWTVAVAAGVIVLLGLFQSGLFAPVKQTNIAMEQTVLLPDSSLVLLNSRSKLTSNYQLIGGKRQLKLEGEAYFKVKKGKPFQLSFPGGKLQVLGTEFNVSAYVAEDIRIDCVSGKVQIEIHNQQVILEKGQGFRLKGEKLEGPYPINQTDVENRAKGIYVWHEEPLDEIFRYIGNRFGYSMSIAPTIQKRNFSGTFTMKNLSQSLEVLSDAMQIKYSIDNNLKQVSIEAK